MTRARILRAGPHVHIRRPGRADESAFLDMIHASRRLHGVWMAPPSTPADFAAYLRRGRKANREQLLVVRNDDDRIAGMINIAEIIRGVFQSAYLGYCVDARLAGTGIMTEGLRLTVRHAFDDLTLHRLEANIQPANAASIALVKRLGFRYEGTARRYLKINGRWRDHEHWVRLREDRVTVAR